MILRYLLATWGTIPRPTVRPQTCLNQRHREAQCTLCMDICPQKAITYDGVLRMNDQCDGCGICTAVCPTQALEPWRNFDMVEAVRERQLPSLLVGCAQFAGEDAHFRLPCLGMLHPEHLFAVDRVTQERNTRLELNLSRCQECSRAEAMETVEALWKPILSDGETGTDDKRMGVRCSRKDGTTRAELSRSDFFRQLARQAERSAQDAVTSLVGEKRGTLQVRNLLLAAAEGEECTFLDSMKWFCGYAVDRGCTACGYCVAICPWQAWTLTAVETKKVLTFDPARCRHCDLCLKTCPENVIRRTPWNGLNQTIAAKVSGKTCRRCRKWHSEAGDFCTVCQKRRNVW